MSPVEGFLGWVSRTRLCSQEQEPWPGPVRLGLQGTWANPGGCEGQCHRRAEPSRSLGKGLSGSASYLDAPAFSQKESGWKAGTLVMVPFGWGMMEVAVSVLNGVFKQTDASLYRLLVWELYF